MRESQWHYYLSQIHCLTMRYRSLLLVLYACVTSSLILIPGCGSSLSDGSKSSSPPGAQAVSITEQPANLTIPIGSPATFTVVATGSGPLHYQWTENGVPVNGANNASYTVASVASADSGKTFAVTVSNSVDSVSSWEAVLTVGARSPKPGDLRFQQVDAPSQADQGAVTGAGYTFMDLAGTQYANATVTPLDLSNDGCVSGVAHDCGWAIYVTPLPGGQTGLSASWIGGSYASFASDLSGSGSTSTMASANSVITSLDLQPANDAYGVTWLTSSLTTGFDLKREVVAPGAVATTVAGDAAQSRVVTALSFDDSASQIDLLSYGWQADQTTTYDTDVVLAGPAIPEVEAAVKTLAQQGYILTAFGGNFSDGFLLVGTKVHGDTTARPILLFDQNSAPAAAGALEGYAPVGRLTYEPQGGSTQSLFVYEK